MQNWQVTVVELPVCPADLPVQSKNRCRTSTLASVGISLQNRISLRLFWQAVHATPLFAERSRTRTRDAWQLLAIPGSRSTIPAVDTALRLLPIERLAQPAGKHLAQLFRKEVAEARSEALVGTIVLRPPNLARPAVPAAILVVAAMTALIFFGSYTRREHVDGIAVPADGVVDVASNQAGSITRVLVREGQTVRNGTALAEVSGESESSAGGQTRRAIGTSLAAKLAVLKADLANERVASLLKKQGLEEEARYFRGELAHLSTEVQLQSERAKSAAEIYNHWQSAGKIGAVSGIQMLQQHDSMLQNQGQLAALRRQELELEQTAAKADLALKQLPIDLYQRENAIQRDISDVSAQIAENEMHQSIVIRAPTAGVVTNISAVPGKSVREGDTILSVVPEGSALRAELFVANESIGDIRPGDEVHVTYDAFKDHQYHFQTGRVTSVSATALSANEASRLAGHSITQPRYQVLVKLTAPAHGSYSSHILPGMTLSADVLLRKRSLLSMLIPQDTLTEGAR